MRKPFYIKKCKAWYVWHEGKQIRLAEDEKEAFDKWAEIRNEPLNGSKPAVLLLDQFLDWVKSNRADRTLDWYQYHLQAFGKHIGKKLTLNQVKPYHVTGFIAKYHQNSSANTVNGAMRAVQRAFNWAVKQGYLTKSPLMSLEKPQPTRREVYIEPAQWQEMLQLATDQQETDLLTTMRATGMRPQEIRVIEAKHYRDGLVVFPVMDSKEKRRNRVIYLTDTAQEIIERLCKENPSGPIFRNSRNEPWTRNAIRLRFKKFKKKLGISGLCSTAIRHVYATEALQAGINPVVLAELLGHTSVDMISRHYGHLSKNPQYLREQAKKAIGQDT